MSGNGVDDASWAVEGCQTLTFVCAGRLPQNLACLDGRDMPHALVHPAAAQSISCRSAVVLISDRCVLLCLLLCVRCRRNSSRHGDNGCYHCWIQ